MDDDLTSACITLLWLLVSTSGPGIRVAYSLIVRHRAAAHLPDCANDMISAIELGRPCRWFSTSRESLRAKPIAANRSIEQEDFEPERGELNPVVTLLEILIILVGILAGFVLLKNRKK